MLSASVALVGRSFLRHFERVKRYTPQSSNPITTMINSSFKPIEIVGLISTLS